MVITVGGQKGGTGKSTIAAELVLKLSQSESVLLVDADDQGTITEFSTVRSEKVDTLEYTSIQLADKNIAIQIPKMRAIYDYIVIDAGGFDSISQRYAISVSDKYLAVFNPESLVLWTADTLEEIIITASASNPNLKCFSCLNKGWPSGSDNNDSAQYLQDSDILTYLPSVVVRRKAFCDATGNGLAVHERKPKDDKAITEIESLLNQLLEV